MHTDEHATIDFIVPDRQIRMIGIDFNLGIYFRIFGAIVWHWYEHGLLGRSHAFFDGFIQMPNGLGFLGRFVIPGPQY